MSEKKNSYFYFMHVQYQHKLDQPVTDYIEDPNGRIIGSKTREFETGSTFGAGTVVTDEPITKFELFLKARDHTLNSTNEHRAKRGQILFDVVDMVITSFDGGRNEIA